MNSTSNRDSIIVAEPQCWGFEHATFNAGLLRMVCLAYPSNQIIFCGEQTHLENVQRELGQLGADRVRFRKTDIPDQKVSGWRHVLSDFSLCNKTLAAASREDARALIFSSATNTSLLALKFLMRTRRFNLPTVTLMHSCLASIAERQVHTPWRWIVGLRRVLALPHPRNLRLIVLGDSILQNVARLLPKCRSQWRALDLVYLWPSNESEMCRPPHPVEQPVRFGFVGVSNKGFDTFCRLADDVAPSQEAAQFMMAGFYNGPAEKKPVCRHIADIPDRPLSRDEFNERLSKLTYVVWTADPQHYRLTASATFLDALAFLKPGIYLRNDYIEHYFERLGDIGYLCDSYEDMVSTIQDILSEFPSVRYRQQIENIRKGRVIFEPDTLAPRLRNIVGNCAF